MGDNSLLDGRLISHATPNNGDVITWDAVLGCWRPLQPTISPIPPTLNQDYYLDGVSGSDTLNTGLTKASPLATLAGFFAKYGIDVPVGAQRRVHLAGTGGADPWEAPTGQQIYSSDEIDIGDNGPVGNRTVFRGPTAMILGAPTTGPATAAPDAFPGGCQICDETDAANPAGQRTRINFVGAAPGWTPQDLGVAGMGYKLRITRAGAKVIFECPIADNGANFIILDTLGIVGVALATDTYEIVYPAARIRGATDLGGGVRAVTLRGAGAPFLALGALTAASMGHSFERLVFEDTFLFGTNITFDRCCFIPGVLASGLVVSGGSCHFKNSMAVQCPVSFNTGGSCYPIGIAASNIPRPDAAADPINQAICIEGAFNQIQVGQTASGTPGYFSADDNLSVYGSPVSGISCVAASIFIQTATCAYLGGNANTAFGITADELSAAVLQAVGGGGTATEIIGATNALRVDDHAGVAYGVGVGAFGEVAGFNGLYHNVSLAAGVTTGRMSVIHI